VGDCTPRGMTVRCTSVYRQNPAYRPAVLVNNSREF
jgi:hypothetical protein